MEMDLSGIGVARMALFSVARVPELSGWVECCFTPGTGKQWVTGGGDVGRKEALETMIKEALWWAQGRKFAQV
jgi:hypothetical protein